MQIKVHLQKVDIQDGKSKMQHYFFGHSTGKFPGVNETSCLSSLNLFLVNGNDLCKWKTAVPELNLLVLKRFRWVFCLIFVFLLLIIVIMFCTELVSSFWSRFLRCYDYCVAYYEVYYFQLPGFVQFWWLKFVLSNKENVNCKILSLNVRGIRSLGTRKALVISLNKQRADIIFFYRKANFLSRLWKKYVQNNKPGSQIS